MLASSSNQGFPSKCMGVRGLLPFIQKTHPDVIKNLPGRLQSLRGKTIVIDGTLITQRLHFAPVPHPYRHVLGWFRLMREFREAGANAICVFDGTERSEAKNEEIARRRQQRRISTARTVIERERLARFGAVTRLLSSTEELDLDERSRARWELKRQFERADLSPDPHLIDEARRDANGADVSLDRVPQETAEVREVLLEPHRHELAANEHADPCPTDAVPAGLEDMSNWGSDISPIDAVLTDLAPATDEAISEATYLYPEDLSEDLSAVAGEIPADALAVTAARVEAAEVHTPARAGPCNLQAESTEPELPAQPDFPAESASHTEATRSQSSTHPYDLAEFNLPAEYGSAVGRELVVESGPLTEPNRTDRVTDDVPSAELGVSTGVDLPAALSKLYLEYRRSIPTLDVLSKHDASTAALEDAQARVAMSKTQAALALEEGAFWQSLVTEDPDASVTPIARLSQISVKSTDMAQSLLRRSSPPTDETYAESRAILEAMGVPVVIPCGPYEAEALASAIVLHGLADYVASEDTDVLVYEAPLIRNITSRQAPLVLIQGSDVRTALALTHSSFVDFALLLGTDFAPRIRNVGPIRALRLIRTHSRIEDVLGDPLASGTTDAEAYLAAVRRARNVFNSLPPIPTAPELEQGVYDEAQVTSIMARYGLQRHVQSEGWDSSAALAGNYFDDDPAVIL